MHPGRVEHAWVDKAFRALIDAVEHPGSGDVVAVFQSLSDLMRAHLGGEELNIAKFADADPEDARALLAQHEGFRSVLDELAASAKAGSLAGRELRELKVRVALHEAHEETGLYRWLRSL